MPLKSRAIFDSYKCDYVLLFSYFPCHEQKGIALSHAHTAISFLYETLL